MGGFRGNMDETANRKISVVAKKLALDFQFTASHFVDGVTKARSSKIHFNIIFSSVFPVCLFSSILNKMFSHISPRCMLQVLPTLFFIKHINNIR
jgi:hypothetical protein